MSHRNRRGSNEEMDPATAGCLSIILLGIAFFLFMGLMGADKMEKGPQQLEAERQYRSHWGENP